MRDACGSDLKMLCGSIQPGGGRIRECIKQHRAELSTGCKVAIADRMLALLAPLISDSHDESDEDDDDIDERHDRHTDAYADHDHSEELATLLRWLQIDRLDRRALNCHLAQLEMTLDRAAA